MSSHGSKNSNSEVFDLRAFRVFSILPDEDADETFCARHNRDMKQLNLILHSDGSLFITAENISTYACPLCLNAAAREIDSEPFEVYAAHLAKVFEQWEVDDAPIEWFRYLGEAEEVKFDLEDREGVIFL